MVCQICNICFNTKERAPMVICPSDHIVCNTCLTSFKEKSITKCPFCRVDLETGDMTQKPDLMVNLAKYENEEKGMAQNNPSMMSEEELASWTHQ